MNDNKFSNGFLLGLIVGGGAVFLLGTKTGKNLLKIASERGLEGFANLLEEYDEDEVEAESKEEVKTNGQVRNSFEKEEVEVKEDSGKKRFFKRIRK